MKAISVRQPWAYAILHLGKRVENRDWRGCSYRGPILLHAAKGCTKLEYQEAIEWMRVKGLIGTALPVSRLAEQRAVAPSLDRVSRGGIVGRARLVDVIQPGRLARETHHDQHRASPWYTGGFALVLADVEPLPYYPYKGALGLFDVPDDVATRLEVPR